MLNKDSIKTLVASSLYSFHDEILKSEFTTKEYVDSKALPVIFINDENKTGPKLFPLLPEHNLVFIAGDTQISDSNGNITVIYGLCYSDLQNDGSKLLTEYRTNKSAKINTSGILESFEYIDSYIKKITDIFKSAINNKMLTTNQNGDFEWIDIPNTNGLATETYVDNKTSMENVIYEGNGTGPDVISDYWTDCPVSKGNGCWVINKQIEFDSSKPNPYYLLCDSTLYSPENSTFDKTNSAWIYPKVHNAGTIFICNKYNNENKLVLPWDDVNSPTKMKLYTKTELAKAMFSGDYNDLSNKPTIPSIKGLATEEYVNNKLIDTTVYLDEDITDTTSTMTYKDEYSAYTFNKLDIASIINGLELKIKVVNNQSDTVGKILTFKDFVYDSTLEAYSAYYNENDSTDTGDKVYITNNNDKTIIVYSTEIMFAGLWKHVKLCRDEDKYAKKTDIHTHANKDVLDTITAEKVAQWDKNAGGSTSGINIVTISQSDYDTLATKDPNTLYLITTTNSGTIDTSTNNITLSDDLPAGAYTLKYEDENNQPLEGFDEITTLEVQ